MRCLYETPAAACKQFKLSMIHRANTLTCRAHNHRKADLSRWYVVASAEWPPFARGLVFADWDPDCEGAIRMGSYLARGISNKAMPELSKPTGKLLVMQRHWHWREILQEGDAEAFIEPILTAAAQVDGGAVGVEIGAAILQHNVSGDPHEGRFTKWDRVVLKVDKAGGIELVNEVYDSNQIESAAKVKDIDELVATLLGYNHDDWMWLEALPFLSMLPEKAAKRGKKNDPADRLVTTHELYETLLAPFDSWVFTEED